jgi:hypothetical protein
MSPSRTPARWKACSRIAVSSFAIAKPASTISPRLALQFHVELPERDMERWLIGHTLELSTSKVDLAKMRTDTARFAPAANAASQRLFNAWLDGIA